jgi:G:T-mismatch repair DNA endonuclease (very short patch repair protein)
MVIKGYKQTEIHKKNTSLAKQGDKNPMFGKPSWNKGILGEEYKKHYKNNKVSGGRPKGYKHSLKSRIKMSKNTIGKKHPNFNLSFEQRQQYAERMRQNRQDFEFNFKMFKSLQNNFTKPHKKVKSWINQYASFKTVSNHPIYVGNKYAEIDEADIINKIAIFIDGNYWHNYPEGRQWDKTVSTFLINRGWKIFRFWESEINNDSELIILKIISIKLTQ